MADEIAVGVVNAETDTTKVTPEVSTPAEPVKVGEEQEPQGTEPDGELDEHGRKRKGGWQRKIERLETESQTKDRIIEELLRRGNVQKDSSTVDSQPSVEPTNYSGKPRPTRNDFDLGDGTYDPESLAEAIAEWKYSELKAKEEHVRKVEAQKAEASKAEQSYNSRRKELVDKYDDYEEAADKAYAVLNSKGTKTPSGGFIVNAIMQDADGNELEYYLGKNPQELNRIANLPPETAIREIGKVLAQFARAESAEPDKAKEPTVPPVTQAPKPATPIKKTSAASAPVDPRTADSDKLSADEWLKARRAQLKGK